MKSIHFVLFIFLLIACKRDDESIDIPSVSSAPYEEEAFIFFVRVNGNQSGLGECEWYIRTMDSTWKNGAVYKPISYPDSFQIDDTKAYRGLLRVYPDSTITCSDELSDPPGEFVLTKVDIISFDIF